MPNMPRFEIENVPPMYSCGFSFFSRARAARSFISAAICASPLVCASRTTGVISPPSIATATDTCADLCQRDALVGVARVRIRLRHQRHGARLDQHVVDRDLHARRARRLVDPHPRRQQVIDLEVDRQREVRHLHEALRQPLRRHLPHAIQRRQFERVRQVDAFIQDLPARSGRTRTAGRLPALRGAGAWRLQHIALDDPPMRPRAFERQKIDALRLRQPLCQRRRLDTLPGCGNSS